MKKNIKVSLTVFLAVCLFCTMLSGVFVFAANEDYVYEGTHSVKIHSEGLKENEKYIFFTQYVKNLTPNTDYVVTCWAKSGRGSIRVMQDNWSTKVAEQSIGGTGSWTQYTKEFNSGSNTTLLCMLTNNPYGGKGDLYVDNVTFCKKGDSKNLLSNPGFEDGETVWSKWADPVFLITSDQAVTPGEPVPTADPSVTAAPTAVPQATATATATAAAGGSDENIPYVYEGYNSVKIHSEGLGNQEKYVFFTQYAKNLEKNTDYVVKFFAKGRSGTVRILDPNWQTFQKEISVGGNEWKEYTYEFNSKEQNTLILAFTGNPYGGKGDIYFDNVSFCKKGDSKNLLANPGFEDGATVWGKFEDPVSLVQSSKYVTPGQEVDPGEMEEVDISEVHGGNASVDMYVGPRSLVFDADNSGREGEVKQAIAVKPNTDYIAMLWVKNADGVDAKFDVTGSDGNSMLSGGPVVIEKNAAWKRLVAYFNSGDSTTAGYTISAKANVEGRVCFDYGTFIAKYKPVTQKTPTNLLLNPDFTDSEKNWTGIEDPFKIHYDNEGKSGDISGGVRVMPVGDSITAGVGAEQDKTGYKYGLFKKYKDDGANVNFVGPSSLGNDFGKGSGHAGYSGWRIDQIDSNIESWMYNYGPQVILLMIGTNDILQDKNDNNLFAGAPDRMEALVDKILAIDPDIQLYVATLTPLNNAGNEAKVKQYNEFLKTMVPTKGENVKLVNIHDALKMSDISKDYTHPNDSGYAKMAQTWFDATHEAVKNMEPSDFAPDKGFAHSGKGSLKYTPYLVPWYTLQKYESTFQYVNVEKNTEYKIRYWIKGDQGLTLQVRIQESNKGSYSWGSVIKSKESACGPKWMPVEYTFNSGDTDLVLVNLINACRSKGTMYIDDVAVWKADDATEKNLIINGECETSEKWPQNAVFTSVQMTDGDYVRDNIEITKDGKKVNALEPGNIAVSADLTDTALSGTLVVAVYQNGVMKTYDKSEQGSGNLRAEVTIDHVDKNTELKVMLLDSEDSIMPHMPAIKLGA